MDLLQRAKLGDQDAKEQLINENVGLVWSIARRYFGRGIDPDDLFQLGCLGFLKAVDGFDPEYGTQFSTYAVPKISGEIRRFLRDDGTIKVSRCLKERALLIKNVRQKLTSRLNREPTLSELSVETQLTVEEIATAENATGTVESIHKENGDGKFTLEDFLTDGSMEDEMVETIALREAIMKLPERERMVIGYRYYRGLTQEQTAKLLDVSQVQVSRIEKKSLALLRSYL